MITRLLRRRIKKASLDVVIRDRNIMVLDSFTDMVEAYAPDGGRVKRNPRLKVIETARYQKMIKELSEKMKKRKEEEGKEHEEEEREEYEEDEGEEQEEEQGEVNEEEEGEENNDG